MDLLRSPDPPDADNEQKKFQHMLIKMKAEAAATKAAAKNLLKQPSDGVYETRAHPRLKKEKLLQELELVVKNCVDEYELPELVKKNLVEEVVKSGFPVLRIHKAVRMYMVGALESEISATLYQSSEYLPLKVKSADAGDTGLMFSIYYMPAILAPPRDKGDPTLPALKGPRNKKEVKKFYNRLKNVGLMSWMPTYLQNGHCSPDTYLNNLLLLVDKKKFEVYREMSSIPEEPIGELAEHVYHNGPRLTVKSEELRTGVFQKHVKSVQKMEKDKKMDTTSIWLKKKYNVYTNPLKMLICKDVMECGDQQLLLESPNLNFEDYITLTTGHHNRKCGTCEGPALISYLLNHAAVVFEVTNNEVDDSDDFKVSNVFNHLDLIINLNGVELKMGFIYSTQRFHNRIGERLDEDHALLFEVLDNGDLKIVDDNFPDVLADKITVEKILEKDYRIHSVVYMRQ